VLYSRPGYGDSDRHEGRSVADCVPDVVAVTAALGIDRFHAVGWSGGGPHALACAALLPGRVISAATIGGVAPWEAEGLDWLAGMGPENLEELGAAAAGPAEIQAYLEGQEPELKEISGSELVGALGGLLTETDKRVLTGELGDFLAAGTREALRNGIWGWLDDDLAFVRPWGFDVGEIEVPVTIWQGREDRFVPFSHGEWLAAHVQGATARLLPEEGHLSLLVSSYDRVLDGLLESGS
jgi:pimeloyl-ACP methyl ester carboxylesterase